jgi:peptidoglycan DL-endopeptidase CwlO
LRQAFIVGAFALVIAGSVAVARAGQSATVAPDQSSSQRFAVTGVNPDMAEWASQFPTLKKSAGPSAQRHIRTFGSRVLARTSRMATRLTRSALRFLGTPYVFGGESPNGFDCSGYVQYVFARFGVKIPRMADSQYYAGKRISGRLSPGDLVFFQTYLPGPSHVGIYLGNGKFVHSAGRGVKVTSLSDSYYAPRYLGAKRFF